MKINKKTRISALIKHNEAAIDAIASISPHFNKLKNPLLRKVLAPRVNIEEAAKIGKSSVETFFEKLSEIGFEIDSENPLQKSSATEKSEIKPDKAIFLSGRKLISLDVRPILAGGKDPFGEIMEKANLLDFQNALEIVNTFEPTPLLNILKKRGFRTLVCFEGEDVLTYVLKPENSEIQPEKPREVVSHVELSELEKMREAFGNAVSEVDVRELEMPLPMMKILESLEKLQPGEALFVHHKKVPQYLLPELRERKFKTFVASIAEGNVKLLIHR